MRNSSLHLRLTDFQAKMRRGNKGERLSCRSPIFVSNQSKAKLNSLRRQPKLSRILLDTHRFADAILIFKQKYGVRFMSVKQKIDTNCLVNFVGEFIRLAKMYEVDLNTVRFVIEYDDDDYVAAHQAYWKDTSSRASESIVYLNADYLGTQYGLDEIITTANEGVYHPPTDDPIKQFARHEFAHLLQSRMRPYGEYKKIGCSKVDVKFAIEMNFTYTYAVVNDVGEFEAERFAYLQEQEPNRRLEPNEWMLFASEGEER